MQKKLLFFISILILNISNSIADEEQGLPPLPTSNQLEINSVSENSGDESFFSKIKEFFGFGKGEQDDYQNSDLKSDSLLTANQQQNHTPSIIETQELDKEHAEEVRQEQEETTLEPVKNYAELPKFSNEYTDEPLSLPKGFEDINDDKEESDKAQEAQDLEPNDAPPVIEDEKNASIIQEKKKEETQEEAPQIILELPSVMYEEGKRDNKNSPEDKDSEMDEPSSEDEVNVVLHLPNKEKIEDNLPQINAEKDLVNISDNIAQEQVQREDNTDEDLDITKYKKEVINNRKFDSPPVINSNQLDQMKEEKIDYLHEQFITNEVQVLILPDDDVVLGRVTLEAKYDLMDFRSYLRVFWENYNKIKREPSRAKIEEFIENYDENFN